MGLQLQQGQDDPGETANGVDLVNIFSQIMFQDLATECALAVSTCRLRYLPTNKLKVPSYKL